MHPFNAGLTETSLSFLLFIVMFIFVIIYHNPIISVLIILFLRWKSLCYYTDRSFVSYSAIPFKILSEGKSDNSEVKDKNE